MKTTQDPQVKVPTPPSFANCHHLHHPIIPSSHHLHHPIIPMPRGRLLLEPQLVGKAVDLRSQRRVVAADLQQLLLRHARGAQLTDLVLKNQVVQQINGDQW